MGLETEAACLLRSGALYSRRLGLRTPNGLDLFAGVKPGGVSIYFGDAPIYHFDLEGRWQRAFESGVHYLKGLDTTVRSIDRDRQDDSLVLRRNTLAYARAVDLDDAIRSMALELVDDLDTSRSEVLRPPEPHQAFEPEDLRTFLERVAAWDSAAWFAHRERYLGTYGPIPFLPPDCPHALILQGTLGNARGRAFGNGRPAEFYVRSSSEFAQHAEAVDRLVGRRLAQNRGIFLGGADVLHRPLAEVLDYLETIARVFPIGSSEASGSWDDSGTRLGTVHAFLDDLDGDLPDRLGWEALHAGHLGRVTIGVESGDPAIRAKFGKTWVEGDLRRVVDDLKAVGIGVGLVVLAGLGSEVPLDATAQLVASLPLEPGDLISVVDAGSLSEEANSSEADQVTALKQRIVDGRVSKGPKVVAYNPDKQWN